MAKKKGKLGRNPLDHLQKVLDEPLAPMPSFIVNGSKRESGSLQKIKEMQIQVDWQELYRCTLGLQVRKLARIFSIF